ncbi:MAG: asparagine synthase (glutamine-hydrolyzing) [Candidatus Omnitrophica bacterium]|nr:asparagine synthase (glutamine-hydrolyzing) [Candidatus Omnitrophota bacterium]
MCGICGIVSFNSKKINSDDLIRMRDTMTNRGPDHGGLEIIDEKIGLGHRRLKIIDLSQDANQPMCNEDGSVWTVFNGEIYNFQELRPKLEACGHHFKSHSDTEIIVHAYEEWGTDIARHLEGMFAIAIWDNKKRQLLLIRDRFGKKPLYYFIRDGLIYFASEIKAIWAINKQFLKLDLKAVDCYLHHFSTTQDHCIFTDVHKVRPGHFIVFDGNLNVRDSGYWQPSFLKKEKYNEDELLDKIDTCLRSAVKKRLVSDVPLGAFLSGGIDSGLVVALAAQLSNKPLQTFSIGFKEQDFNELSYAGMVAKRYKTDHREIIVDPDFLDILPDLVWEYGEPFADSSAIPTYFVSKAARQFVTVALTGDGGDELFGGYPIAKASYYAALSARVLPSRLRESLGKISPAKIRTVLSYASDDPKIRHSHSMAFSCKEKKHLYKDPFRGSLEGHHSYHIYENFIDRRLNIIDQNLLYTNACRLPNDYLIKVDVASMRNSLELRSPFLDYELNVLSESIDPFLKVKNGCQKYLLKKLAERYLPREVIYRPKQGFELPIAHWFRKDLADVFECLVLNDGSLARREWFDMVYVRRILEAHKSGVEQHTHRLWSLLWLEIWFRLFIDDTLKPTDSLRPLIGK